MAPKNLIGIPWRVAFALQKDGWYLRQDIIWSKPNPKPESVKDRCTKSHEYLFLLSKSEKYYYDSDSIRVSLSPTSSKQNITRGGRGFGIYDKLGVRQKELNGRNPRSVWEIPTKPFSGAHFAVMPEALVEPCVLAGSRFGDTIFDPFFGSGTVGVVATRLGRNWVGCELNPKYVEIANARIRQQIGGFNIDPFSNWR